VGSLLTKTLPHAGVETNNANETTRARLRILITMVLLLNLDASPRIPEGLAFPDIYDFFL